MHIPIDSWRHIEKSKKLDKTPELEPRLVDFQSNALPVRPPTFQYLGDSLIIKDLNEFKLVSKERQAKFTEGFRSKA